MSFWDQLVDSLESVGAAIGDWTPRILVALLILLVGRWIARFIRTWVRRLLDKPAVKSVFDRTGITGTLDEAGYSLTSILANVIYAILILIVFLLAAEALALPALVDLLQRLIAFLPKIVVALVILILTAAVGNFLGDLVRPWGENRGVPWIHYVARWAVIIFGLITAFDVLEIGYATRRILEFGLGAVAVAFAVAFGIGGIETARKWWAKYLSPAQSGQTPPQH